MQVAEILSEIPDTRAPNSQYTLGTVISTVIAAFLCGRDSLAGVKRFTKGLSREELAQLGFCHPNHVPCHATFCNIIADIDADALEKVLCSLVIPGDHIAIDGKRLRGSRTGSVRGVHVLEAFSNEVKAVLAQEEMSGDENEVGAALRLLKRIDLKDKIITGDAMFAQPAVAKAIIEGEGDYILAVKDNQKSLKTKLEASFEAEDIPPSK